MVASRACQCRRWAGSNVTPTKRRLKRRVLTVGFPRAETRGSRAARGGSPTESVAARSSPLRGGAKKTNSYTRVQPFFPSRPQEHSLLGQCERSDHRESTDTRQLIEVKPYRARLVLRWVTTLESRVALSFLFATFAIFFSPLPVSAFRLNFCVSFHMTKKC